MARRKKTTMNYILDDMMSNCIGGDINSYATVVKKDSIEFHFWNGERFLLTRQPNGCEYCTNCASSLSNGVCPKKGCKR